MPGTGHFIHHLCLRQRPLKTSHSPTQRTWEMFSVKEILLGKELLQEIRRNLTSFLQAPSLPSTPSKCITTGEGKGTEEQIPETPVRTSPLSVHCREICRALQFALWCSAMCCFKMVQAQDRVSGAVWYLSVCPAASQKDSGGGGWLLVRGCCKQKGNALAELGQKSPKANNLAMLKSGVRFPDAGIGQSRGQHLFWKGR